MNGVTVKELLCSARSTLCQLDTARLDTEVLLASVMNTDRETLYAYPETELPDEIINTFLSLVSKRTSHFPIAYLTGYKEFWSTNLTVNRHTLIPRPETEVLVQIALDLIPDNNTKYILDLGTGSGAIAIAIAKEKAYCQIVASDISNEAIVVAKTNAAQQQLSTITFIQSDLFSELDNEIFDLILCNPPYVGSHDKAFQDEEIRYEPRIALNGGHLGMQIIKNIIPMAVQHLKQSGYLILEHGCYQGAIIRQLLIENKYEHIRTLHDYSELERVSLARKSHQI